MASDPASSPATMSVTHQPSPPASSRASPSSRRPGRAPSVDAPAASPSQPSPALPAPSPTLSSLLTIALLPDDDDAPHPLTLTALSRACSGEEGSSSGDDSSILSVHTVRLSWMNLTALAHTELLTHVRELYLNYNRLTDVTPVQVMLNLEFLAMSHNRLKFLPDLTQLKRLQVLDASHNCMTDLNAAIHALPSSLILLNLKGNPGSSSCEWRRVAVERLPHLDAIDGEDVDLNPDEDEGEVEPEVEAEQASELEPGKGRDLYASLADSSRALEGVHAHELGLKFSDARRALMQRYSDRVAVEVERMGAAATAATAASQSALDAATSRLHGLRAAMSVRLAEREAAHVEEIAAVVKAFKAIGGRGNVMQRDGAAAM